MENEGWNLKPKCFMYRIILSNFQIFARRFQLDASCHRNYPQLNHWISFGPKTLKPPDAKFYERSLYLSGNIWTKRNAHRHVSSDPQRPLQSKFISPSNDIVPIYIYIEEKDTFCDQLHAILDKIFKGGIGMVIIIIT